jgi:uncharacterized protein involved in outer membrane biogenesis
LQTTLLGIAIAIILALVAALVGPLMIDWGGYRALFEKEATSLVGVPVHVAGKIDARLLPTPRLTLHDIEIGRGHKIRARSLGIEFALGPLMRGQWKASQLRLVGPQLSLGLDGKGHVKAPSLAIGFDPDALTIDRLNIQDGTLTLTDASKGRKVTLDKVWFNGQARSLLGPFQGEGAATVGGDLYPFRLAAGRYADGKMTLRVNVDPVSYPLSIQTDGTLAFAAGAPHFDGKLNLTRPVGIAVGSKNQLSQPWNITGKIKVSSTSALMQDLQFKYGSEDKGFTLTGDADLRFAPHPHFQGVLSARQIDLDSTLAGDDGTQPPPAAALRKIAELAGGAFRPPIPTQIGIGIDQITLGGDAVQNVRGDISTDAKGWSLDRFEFRAPGYTQVRLSGRLAVAADRVAFTGPASLKTNYPKQLTAWLEGRPPAGKGPLRPLSLRGDLTLATDKVAVEHLAAEIDRKSVTGGFVYLFAAGKRPTRLDAALHAPDLDIDAVLGFGRALLAGSHIARPDDMTIVADIGHATIGGFTARDASARLKVDDDGLRIDKLSVADLGGAAFSASGRIVTSPSPQGRVQVDLNAPDMAPVMALLSRFAPRTAALLGRGASAMAPAKLHASLTVQGAAPKSVAKLSLAGTLGQAQLALDGETHGDLTALKSDDLRLDGKLSTHEGETLVAMLGLGHVVAVASGPGTLRFDANGPLSGELKVDGKLSAGGLKATVKGIASPFADTPGAALRAAIARADFSPLRNAGGGNAALPVTFAGRIALAGKKLTLNDIDASVAGSTLRGRLGYTLGKPHQLSGTLAADHVDGAALVAAAIGMPAKAESDNKAGAWQWPDAPFGSGILGDYGGSIALKTRRVDLSPQLTARQVSATLSFGKDALALEHVAGVLAGGRLAGRLAFNAGSDGLTARSKLDLSGADLNALLPSGARPPVTGTLALSGEVEGTGLSPVALIGSLQGKGKFTLTGAQFAGLDPRAFDVVTHAVDQGLRIDADRISDVVSKALESGDLAVKRAQGTLAVSAGQVRLAKFSADSDQAKLSLSGNLDLTGGALDARLVLSGTGEAAGTRPDIFMALQGPVAAPKRSIDVSALTGWLTLRSIEIQAKKVRELERERARERKREQEMELKLKREQAARPPPTSPAANGPAAKGRAPGNAAPNGSKSNRAVPNNSVRENTGSRSVAPKHAAPSSSPVSRRTAPSAGHDAAAAPLRLTPRLDPKVKRQPQLMPMHDSSGQRAPALPPPVDIGPAPALHGAGRPEASAFGR